jgi:sulfiredoxin
MHIAPLPIDQIRRPLPRQTDPAKVQALMTSIAAIGQQAPIEILAVEGIYYGFSGCHRFEACQQLGQSTVLCRIRRAPRSVLQMHLA